jgi:hypothetical protein
VNATRTRTVAVLLFDDVEVLDFAGPFEVFGVTETAAYMEVRVAISAALGLADTTIERAPCFQVGSGLAEKRTHDADAGVYGLSRSCLAGVAYDSTGGRRVRREPQGWLADVRERCHPEAFGADSAGVAGCDPGAAGAHVPSGRSRAAGEGGFASYPRS